MTIVTREPREIDAGLIPCRVDGCTETVSVVLVPRLPDGTTWMVSHGSSGEAKRMYSTDELLVNTGYAPWVRNVHEYEAMRGTDGEAERLRAAAGAGCDVLTLREVAAYLHIGLGTARSILGTGRLVGWRVGGPKGHWRVSKSELDAYIERRNDERRLEIGGGR